MNTAVLEPPTKEDLARLYEKLEDGVDTAKRTVTRGLHNLEDLRDTASYRVKRAPLVTTAAAFGIGILLGAIVGRLLPRCAGEPSTDVRA